MELGGASPSRPPWDKPERAGKFTLGRHELSPWFVASCPFFPVDPSRAMAARPETICSEGQYQLLPFLVLLYILSAAVLPQVGRITVRRTRFNLWTVATGAATTDHSTRLGEAAGSACTRWHRLSRDPCGWELGGEERTTWVADCWDGRRWRQRVEGGW